MYITIHEIGNNNISIQLYTIFSTRNKSIKIISFVSYYIFMCIYFFNLAAQNP